MANKASDAVIRRIWEMTAKKGPIGLARMRRLLELLGNPESNLKCIHVAGTNGKGSICRFIASVLCKAGYSVGIFTSPHVMEYNERFEVDGNYISDDDFCRIADYVMSFSEQLNEEGYGYMSEFEILTSTAFIHFRETGPDIAILETGIGGRIDMTNVISSPLITVISQIGFDHVGMLGNSLSEIAAAKAGIIKAGVPVVSESSEPEVVDVISSVAGDMNSEFIDASKAEYTINSFDKAMNFDFSYQFNSDTAAIGIGVEADINGITGADAQETTAQMLGDSGTGGADDGETAVLKAPEKLYMTNIVIRLLGEHQVRNAITAILALNSMAERGLIKLSENQLRTGLAAAVNMGRFEILDTEPYVMIDGAHNPQGLKASMATLLELTKTFLKGKRILTIFGCFSDKDYVEMTEILANGLKEAGCEKVIATEPISERALPAAKLAELLNDMGIEAVSFSDEREAFDRAMSSGYDALFFVGSIYLIGDIRIFFQSKGREN